MRTLHTLGLAEQNAGSFSSAHGWLSGDTAYLTSINPSTGEPIAKVYPCEEPHYQTIVQDAVTAQLIWAMQPAPNRGRLIYRLGELLRQHKDALGYLVTLETGKLKQEGDGEIQEMIDMADFAVGQSRMLYGNSMHSERPQHRMYEQWLPLGVVGVITAFNFPVAVWAWNAFIAAIAGNCVIWKPSSTTPLCAIAIQHLCQQAMSELGTPGVFSLLLPRQSTLTEKLVSDPRLPLISFTGSSHTGCKVAMKVAERMGRSLLECSGNNAIIIDQSANLALAIPAVLFGAIGTAGQRCTSTRRLFVHEAIYDQVKHSLIRAYRQIPVGNPMDPMILMGPLISPASVTQYCEVVAQIRQQGNILFGGQVLPGAGFFVEPCLAELALDSPLLQTETFAPILYLLRYSDLGEAIRLHNAVPQGLSSAIFTNTLQHAELFLSVQGSDCGIANVNIGTSGAEIGGAFGGEKMTGGGREAGSDSWKAYMRRQTTTINWGNELPLAQGIQFSLPTG